MTIPSTIPFSSIDLGIRGRTEYKKIEELAESLEHNGLIQPIVLTKKERCCERDYNNDGDCDHHPNGTFALVAGGRRYHALQQLGVTELHHGVTSEPGRYGFLLRGESTVLSNLLTEIAENLDRSDVDWRDECKMIVRAAKLIRQESHANGHMILARDLGVILGCGYNNLITAEKIHDDLVAHPEDYVNVTGLRAAVQVIMKKDIQFLQSIQVERSLTNKAQSVPILEEEKTFGDHIVDRVIASVSPGPVTTIPLTSHFLNTDGIEWLWEHPASVDHVICDPDFGVSVDRLMAKADMQAVGYATGVNQKTVEQSLIEVDDMIHAAFGAIKEQGFLVMFFDMDHWEKLCGFAIHAGFAVQRWPLTWHKTDFRSNASPQSNFCKNEEWAMVCRKPGSVLATVQMSSVFSCPGDRIAKELGHPFCKPYELWTWIFQAVCLKGQTVFDPCVGAGSMAIAAIRFGLNPMGAEIQTVHYNSLILNLQKEYQKLLGENVRFE
jgi:hypothetical protein